MLHPDVFQAGQRHMSIPRWHPHSAPTRRLRTFEFRSTWPGQRPGPTRAVRSRLSS